MYKVYEIPRRKYYDFIKASSEDAGKFGRVIAECKTHLDALKICSSMNRSTPETCDSCIGLTHCNSMNEKFCGGEYIHDVKEEPKR